MIKVCHQAKAEVVKEDADVNHAAAPRDVQERTADAEEDPEAEAEAEADVDADVKKFFFFSAFLLFLK